MDPLLLFGGAAALTAFFLKHRTAASSSARRQQQAALCLASCREIIEAAENPTETFGHAALDDNYLYAELKAAGIPFDVKAWDDETVDWKKYLVTCIRTTWDYSHSEAQGLRFLLWTDRLQKLGVSLFNHPRVIAFNASKLYLKDLAAAGIPVIPTVYVSPLQLSSPSASSSPMSLEEALSKHRGIDLRAIQAKTGWRDLVLKPCVSAGSRDTIRYRESEGQEALDKAQRFLFDLVTLGYDTTKEQESGEPGSPIGVVMTPQNNNHNDNGEHHHHHHHHDHGSAHHHHNRHHNHHHHRHTESADSATSARSGASSASSSKAMQEVLLHPSAGDNSAKSGSSTTADEAGSEAQRLADATSSAVRRARAASASAPLLSARAAPELAPPRHATADDASPCSMMVQPYLPSVGDGEISVIVIDGRITHAVQKNPVKGDFRSQEEYGGVQRKITLTAAEEAHVMQVLEVAKSVIGSSQPPSSPVTPGQVHTFGGGRDSNPLPDDALMIARVDFLRFSEEAAASVGHHTAISAAPADQINASPSDDGIVVSGTPLSLEKTPLLLLELEVIEPCLFFGVDAKGIAGAGAPKAIAQRPAAAGQSLAARVLTQAIQRRLKERQAKNGEE